MLNEVLAWQFSVEITKTTQNISKDNHMWPMCLPRNPNDWMFFDSSKQLILMRDRMKDAKTPRQTLTEWKDIYCVEYS